MKIQIKLFTAALALLLFVSCGTSAKDQVAGTWIIKSMTMEGPDGQKQTQELPAEQAEKMAMEFMADGKMKSANPATGSEETGTWELKDGDKTLHTKGADGKEDDLTIVALEADKMVLKIEKEKMEITFARKK